MLTLRTRLVLANVLVFLVTIVLLVGVLSGDLVLRLYAQVDAELAQQSHIALEHVGLEDGRLRLHERDEQAARNGGDQGFVRLLDAQGRVADGVGAYNTAAVTRMALAAPARGAAASQRVDDGTLWRVYTQPLTAQVDRGTVVGYVQVGVVPQAVIDTTSQLLHSLLIATPLALLGAALAALWAARRALRPLTQMTASAAAIGADSLAKRRLPVPRPRDELQALALDFNAMLDRLAAAFARQRRFTADASHELRTPVTAILGQAELALHRPRDVASYQASLRRIEGEAARMQRLIERLLMLARAEEHRLVVTATPTDIAALLRTLAETLAPEAEAKGIRLAYEGPGTLTAATDADILTQVMLNLMENAVAYTEQGAVAVALRLQAGHVLVEVRDSGPGIAAADLPLLFEPFYRADPSRQRRSGGVGLGLALAHELAQLLGGTLTAANRLQGGAVFTLELPAPQPTVSA